MKIVFSFLLSLSFVLLYSQKDYTEDINQLRAYIDAEDFRSAMVLGDKLIGEGVKEGLEKYAGEVYLYRGIAKYKFDIFDDAIVDLKQAVAFNRNLTEAYLYISEIYYSLERYSSSLENIIYYVESHPEDVHGLAVKSKCLLELGEPMAAKIIIQKAISIVSSEPELYYVRAVINYQLDEKKKACADANIALKFGYEEAQSLVESFCNEE